MASNVLPSTPTTITSSSIQTYFFPKTSKPSILKKKQLSYFLHNNRVSCKATTANQNQSRSSPSNNKNNGDKYSLRFDRRDVLIGIGGLYGATNLVNYPFALADPIQAPDFTECKDSVLRDRETKNIVEYVPCCPPTSSNIINFELPSNPKIRTRPAAHLVDPKSEYFSKFLNAMELMKALPKDDPRSFIQQANVHCAYCNEAYEQVGFSEKTLQVHNSALFLPFHRLYLYFYERILGNLIGDPDFAMPFWNWDHPDGMSIPAIYTIPNSPLYDKYRNEDHQPPNPVDLSFPNSTKDSTKRDEIKINNLSVMYKEIVTNDRARLFHGSPYKAGDKPNPGAGSIERGSHTAVHAWCGRKEGFHEDMGNFYSAGRDPLFYAHHANVDRMWYIWKQLPGKSRNDFKSSEWLDASFLFYDENANLVRVKVRDCLDNKKLGYDYQGVEIPWRTNKPRPHMYNKNKKGGKHRGHAMAAEVKTREVVRNIFPISLDKIVRIEIPRLTKRRSKVEKEDEEEVLVIEKIQLEGDVSVRFDVYINDEDDETPTGPQDSEYAGTFTSIPGNSDKKVETNLILPLTELLEELDVEGDDSIVVTLVPKEGKGLVSIGNIKIDFISDEDY